jgi:hypothetical protein
LDAATVYYIKYDESLSNLAFNLNVRLYSEELPKCPGRNPFGCGSGPNSTSKYWQHPCNPLVTPQSKGMTFWCSLNTSKAEPANAFSGGGERGGGGTVGADELLPPGSTHLCYWTQPGVIPSLAVTCSVVGRCRLTASNSC